MNVTMLEEQIMDILAGQFKVERDAVGAEVTFAELRFDSLVLIELGLVLEKQFGIAVEDGELTDSMTLAEAAELIHNKGAVV